MGLNGPGLAPKEPLACIGRQRTRFRLALNGGFIDHLPSSIVSLSRSSCLAHSQLSACPALSALGCVDTLPEKAPSRAQAAGHPPDLAAAMDYS